TGQLFEFSCEAGAILGQATAEHRDRLRAFARDMGLVFQITDDLLDVTSTAEKTGKAVGKDGDQGKATLVSLLGVEGARAEAGKLARRAAATLAPYGTAALPPGPRVLMPENLRTPLLDTIQYPADLRRLDKAQLRALADELRAELIDAVSVSGGHFGAGLGVVELTVALHYVFDTPNDRIVWDVGHQAYPHKILTGRRDRIRSIRQGGGLSG